MPRALRLVRRRCDGHPSHRAPRRGSPVPPGVRPHRGGEAAAAELPGRLMDQRMSLITLGVSDLPRARAFYEALGWHTNAGPDDDVVFFQAGGMVVALWDRARLAEDSGVEDNGGWGGITL